ncbi:MAG: type II toxin-antitoxin system HicA family toxin [Phycisphaerales bacterium]|nr:type II toxin-antitoxin system HicA family toxin [Phycisphaerales bacterium]
MASEVRFAEVRKKLEQHGWTLSRISGSHHVFVKPGERSHISIPVHAGRVKPKYLRKIERDFGISF